MMFERTSQKLNFTQKAFSLKAPRKQLLNLYKLIMLPKTINYLRRQKLCSHELFDNKYFDKLL